MTSDVRFISQFDFRSVSYSHKHVMDVWMETVCHDTLPLYAAHAIDWNAFKAGNVSDVIVVGDDIEFYVRGTYFLQANSVCSMSRGIDGVTFVELN